MVSCDASGDLSLVGAAYRLGEQRRRCADLEDFVETLAGHDLPCLPHVLGLGEYRKTDDVFALASSSVGESLDRSGRSAAAIECVVFCSSRFGDDFIVQNRGCASVLAQQGLSPRFSYCVSGTGCAAFFSGVQVASGLITSGEVRQALVVTLDSYGERPDRERFIPYAVMSDSASSVLLCSDGTSAGGLRIRGQNCGTNVAQMLAGTTVDNVGQNRAVVAKLLATHGLEAGDVARIFSNNIFLPIKSFKEARLGFSSSQLYLDNVVRTAHCLSSDALINLIDYLSADRSEGETLLLYSEAEGHVAAMLVET